MSTRFQIYPDCAKIVIDTQTGLLWQREFSANPLNHADAVQYAANLELGGLGNWRLPTIEEWMAILTIKPNAHGYYQDAAFADRDGKWLWCWSGTIPETTIAHTHKTPSAWIVLLEEGREKCVSLVGQRFVRAVREG